MNTANAHRPVALVTGVGRKMGLGFEICRQLASVPMTVLLTARDLTAATDHARTLSAEGLHVRAQRLDVTSGQSVAALAGLVEREFGTLHVLVNNAGGHFDYAVPTLDATPESLGDAFETNVLGAWRVTLGFLPLLRASGSGRIVNVASEAGSFGAPNGMGARGGTLAAYSVTKAALNAVTVKLSAALAGSGVLVNSVCPGFVATYPGTFEMGARPVREGARGVVWAATLPEGGPSGGFFRDGQPLAF